MEETHQYRVVAWWTSGLTGIAKSDSAPNAIHFTAPPEFGGLQGRWTPEELLLGAVGGCFTTTFRTIAAHANFEYADLEVETQGTAAKTADGYRFGEIVIRPRLTISSEEERNRGVDLLKKAKALCLVSRALAVTQTFQPLIAVGKDCPRRLIGFTSPAKQERPKTRLENHEPHLQAHQNSKSIQK